MKIYAPIWAGDDGLALAMQSLPAQPTVEDVEAALWQCCGSYARMPFLLHSWYTIDEDEWVRLLFDAWEFMDNIGAYLEDLWDTPFSSVIDNPHEYHHLTMTAEELAHYHQLSDVIEVYRGCYANNKRGLSWSLDQALAEGFPLLSRYSHSGQPLLVRGRVAKSSIIAVKLGRDEGEIVTMGVKHISTSHIRAKAAGKIAA
jgi:hypothetical protein